MSPYGMEVRTRLMSPGPDINDAFIALFSDGIAQQVTKDIPVATLNDLTFGSLLSLARSHIDGLCKLDDRLLVAAVEACWDAIKR